MAYSSHGCWRMATFNQSTWRRKEDAFLPWGEEQLVATVERHPLSLEDMHVFYTHDVRSVTAGDVQGFSLMPNSTIRAQERFAQCGFYDVEIPDGLPRDEKALALLSAFGHGFYRAAPARAPVSGIVAQCASIMRNERERLYAIMEEVPFDQQMSLLTADIPPLPAGYVPLPVPSSSATSVIVRGMRVFPGGRTAASQYR